MYRYIIKKVAICFALMLGATYLIWFILDGQAPPKMDGWNASGAQVLLLEVQSGREVTLTDVRIRNKLHERCRKMWYGENAGEYLTIAPTHIFHINSGLYSYRIYLYPYLKKPPYLFSTKENRIKKWFFSTIYQGTQYAPAMWETFVPQEDYRQLLSVVQTVAFE